MKDFQEGCIRVTLKNDGWMWVCDGSECVEVMVDCLKRVVDWAEKEILLEQKPKNLAELIKFLELQPVVKVDSTGIHEYRRFKSYNSGGLYFINDWRTFFVPTAPGPNRDVSLSFDKNGFTLEYTFHYYDFEENHSQSSESFRYTYEENQC